MNGLKNYKVDINTDLWFRILKCTTDHMNGIRAHIGPSMP